jgi:hypothetical protein
VVGRPAGELPRCAWRGSAWARPGQAVGSGPGMRSNCIPRLAYDARSNRMEMHHQHRLLQVRCAGVKPQLRPWQSQNRDGSAGRQTEAAYASSALAYPLPTRRKWPRPYPSRVSADLKIWRREGERGLPRVCQAAPKGLIAPMSREKGSAGWPLQPDTVEQSAPAAFPCNLRRIGCPEATIDH